MTDGQKAAISKMEKDIDNLESEIAAIRFMATFESGMTAQQKVDFIVDHIDLFNRQRAAADKS